MRLLTSWAVAGLAGLASAATNEPADVYILSKSSASTSSSPQIPRQVARDIILSRVGAQARFGDLPDTVSTDDALSYISQYGKAPKPLNPSLNPQGGAVPSQLVVLLEGVTKNNAKTLKEGLGSKPAFAIADPPSAEANKYFIGNELSSIAGSCDVGAAINPYSSCWNGLSLVVKYDVGKNPETLDALVNSLTPLRTAVSSESLEAVLILLPESSRSPEHGYWTTNAPSELRRRVETPISDTNVNPVVASDVQVEDFSTLAFVAQQETAKLNLGCFTSYNSCVSATNNCTGHGNCLDKYAMGTSGGQSGDKQCFVCYCIPTETHPDDDEDGQFTHWGGAYCQKIDVSSPFWLLVGTTVILIGLVGGSIALLFSVGEEKLPGVIGAGVSRSK